MVLLSVCLIVSSSVLTGCSPCHLFWAPFLLVRIYRFATSFFFFFFSPCLLQTAGGWRPPAASGKHRLQLDRVRIGRGSHSASSGGDQAPSLAVSGMAESEGF